MKKLLFFFAMCLWLPSMAQVSVSSLKVNHLVSPVGLTEAAPTFSWVLSSDKRNVTQSAYEIKVYQGNKQVWDSGRIESDNSVTVRYEGEKLVSGTRYYWQVRVWDNAGKASKWSERATWLTGMLTAGEWQAKWIEPKEQGDAAPMLRKSFALSKPVASAVAYVTSHGMNEVSLNGSKVGNAHYAPGWTSYDKRLQYNAYDVTGMLAKGENVFGIMLGHGWYLSRIGWSNGERHQLFASNKMSALAQIVVTYKDGTQEVIVTDGSWKASTGEILYSELYDGETIDARKQQKGWNAAGFDDSKWAAVNVADYPMDRIVGSESEPVITHELKSPVEVITTPKGEKVLDFGQNLVGREILTYKGKAGQEILISHAEVLDENGNFYTVNLRSAKALSHYICSGEQDRFEATFTFYGFRYLKVEGIEGELNPDDFKAAVVFSDIAENGNFSSSNEQVNQLQHNIQWGLRGNFVDVPTDCPQRDERLGWTGDAEVFFRTATFNRDVQNFFRKWMKDVAADQLPDGRISHVVPRVLDLAGYGSTGWADAATIIPWQHYMAYGDKRILENQYTSMKAWVDYMINNSKDYLWASGWHYGDWLFYSVDNDNSGVSAVTYKPLIQQCFFANSAEMVANAAAVLGMKDEAAQYAEVARKAKDAFCNAYLTPAGYLVSSTQTAYVLALNFNMLPENMRPVAADRLAEKVREYGHITTGFLGTPYICHVLSENGYTDLAYSLLLRQQYPGWLYPVTMGATTIWERWNSMMPDHTIPDNGMNSFNHYSYGAIGDWLYRDAVGLHETSAGFKTMAVKPHAGGGFTQMSAEQQTPYGKAAAEWHDVDGVFSLKVTIPVNTTAEIYVPSSSADAVMLDGVQASQVKDVVVGANSDGYTKVSVGSGTYTFEVK